MRFAFKELAHLIVERGGFGDEVGLHRDRHDVEFVHLVRVHRPIFEHAVHGTQEVLGVEHTDHVFGIIAIERQTGVRAFENLCEDFRHRQTRVDHLNARAVEHDLFDKAL